MTTSQLLDPHQLAIFLAAAEALNFSRAAERLGMSQPSVTQHIHALEQHFDTPLFIRTGNRITLSEAGQALVPLARQMVAVSQRTGEVMEALKGEVQGQLNIGCSTTPGKYILPVLLADFMRRYPRVQATCNVSQRTQALQMLEDGRVHLAFSSSLDEFSGNIEFRKFISDPVVLIVPLGHRWTGVESIPAQELRGERFIFREEEAGTFRVVRSGLARVGVNVSDLHPVLTLGNSEAIAIAVQQGMGVGFVSKIVYKRIVEDQVGVVKIDGVKLTQDIFIGRHRYNPSPRVQTAFWDYVLDEKNEIVRDLVETFGH
jgi:DNA-binding transcriptional LysR family regulator